MPVLNPAIPSRKMPGKVAAVMDDPRHLDDSVPAMAIQKDVPRIPHPSLQ